MLSMEVSFLPKLIPSLSRNIVICAIKLPNSRERKYQYVLLLM